MSKSSKKTGRRVRRQSEKRLDMGDVTLNDFANSSVSSSKTRVKKNTIKTVVNVKQLATDDDDRAWDEKLYDLEVALPEEEDIAKVVETKKFSARRRRKVSVKEEDISQRPGNNYPIDIWFLISDYIHPEDVGTFAGICKTSHAVVSTAKFWFSLYKRYYRNVPNLPERLQPECIVRRYGLRAYVIRALHFMYPPFINKLKPHTTFEEDPHILIKRQCVLAWSQKVKNQWLFYFKLKEGQNLGCGRNSRTSSSKPDLLEMLEDIFANVDDNCKVLQVTCLNYIPIPMIFGQTLCGVSLTLSQGMRYHRLQLNFGCGPVSYMAANLQIVLDPVVNLRVLNWWHPLFPHSDGFQSTSFSKEVSSHFEDLDF